MIRLLAILLVVLHINAGAAFSADQAGSDLGDVGSAVLKTVAAGAFTLQITPTGGNDNSLLWAAWDGYAANSWAVHLVLLRRKKDAVVTTWSVLHDSSRSPVLEIVPGWKFDQRPALLVRYQLGAADSRADVYGVNTNDTATQLNMLEGALIEIFQFRGKEMLRVYQTADLHGAPKCFGWNTHLKKLTQQTCNSN